MSKQGSGFKVKLYWRGPDRDGRYHCVERAGKRFESLCGRFSVGQVYCQSILRPAVIERCGDCDGREMEIRGWTESGPATVSEQPDD